MSAGTGVRHSEFNASDAEASTSCRSGCCPAGAGIAPGYEQKTFGSAQKDGRLCLVASADGAEGSVTVHADARVYAGVFGPGAAGELALGQGRYAWVQVARGRVRVDGQDLEAGDGAALWEVPAVRVEGITDSEVLVFDLG